jgi:hypothetical protein
MVLCPLGQLSDHLGQEEQTLIDMLSFSDSGSCGLMIRLSSHGRLASVGSLMNIGFLTSSQINEVKDS